MFAIQISSDASVLILLLGLIVLVLMVIRSSRFKGAVGERRVKSSLRSKLDETLYTVIDDLTLQVRGGTTQIDHVVVSRYGVFVIETKNMSGWIFGSADQRTWTQTLRRQKFKMQNPIHQNFKHVKAVQEVLKIELRKIRNVVVFVGSAEPKTAMPPNVVWSVDMLAAHIKQFHLVVLDEGDVSTHAAKLRECGLGASRKTRREHIRHVKSQVANRSARAGGCPRCGAEMVERTNRQSGSKFLGCSRYPGCKSTRKIT